MSELTQAQIKITPFKISRFQIAIKGLSPLVMHAWSEKAKAMVRMTPTERKKLPKEERTPEETAHECAYRCDDHEPSHRCLQESCDISSTQMMAWQRL